MQTIFDQDDESTPESIHISASNIPNVIGDQNSNEDGAYSALFHRPIECKSLQSMRNEDYDATKPCESNADEHTVTK